MTKNIKKILTILICIFLVGCQTIPTNNIKSPIKKISKLNKSQITNTNISKINGFKTKNINSINIKKTILTPQRFVRKTGKPETIIINFEINKNDLERKMILNVVNGPDGNTRISSAWIKVNGELILNSDSFNQDIPDTSVLVKNFKEGSNTLEVKLASKPGSIIDVSIEGFIEPINISGAMFSNIPDNPTLRQAEYVAGIVGIKFLEGMKVRLIENPDGTKDIVDLNGISLTPLKNLMNNLGVKSINRAIGAPPDELDTDEIKAESLFGTDIPNQNLFYYLEFETTSDVWSIIDQMRILPFIEESFPQFIPQKSLSMPPDTSLPSNKTDWLKAIHVMRNSTDLGAWSITQGNPSVKIAVLDYGAQISGLFPSGWVITHEDFLDSSGSFTPNLYPISNVDLSKITSYNDLSHGTGSAAIIGAIGDNGKGSAGIAYKSTLMPIHTWAGGCPSACKGGGNKNCNPTADTILLARKNGAKVIIIEAWWPGSGPGTSLTVEQANPIERAAIASAVADGKTVIVSAGNGGNTDISTATIKGKKIPWPDTGSIVVGGLNLSGNKISGYNYGINTLGGHGTDVSAVAERVVWTADYNNTYNNFSGTSAGVVEIGGIVALMLSVKSDLTPLEIRDILKNTAAPPVPSTTSPDRISGMVNAFDAVNQVYTPSYSHGIEAKFYANTIYMPPEPYINNYQNGTSVENKPYKIKTFNEINMTASTHDTWHDTFSIGLEDFFVADFNGVIKIDSNGFYTFWIGHDDGAILQIDGENIIDANYPTGYKFDLGVKYLSKGYHSIRLLYNEITGESPLTLWWKKPGGSIEIVPQNVLFHTPSPSSTYTYSPKLIGRFIDTTDNPPWNSGASILQPFEIKFFDMINYANPGANWGDTFGIGKTDNFSGFFSGFVKPPKTGNYKFLVGHDDGSILWVNNQALIWQPSASDYKEDESNYIYLDSNKYYQLILTYNEYGYESELSLKWVKPNGLTETIPASSLYH